MPKPNIKKAIHTGQFDHLSTASVRRAVVSIRFDLEDADRAIAEKRVQAHWVSLEERPHLDATTIAERHRDAMLSLQRLNGRRERLHRRFLEAWHVWQQKEQEENQQVTSNQ